jgi:hypothetical protein
LAASKDVDWDTCAEDSCIGVRLQSGGKCWAHADDQTLEAALKHLGEGGDLDARGVPIAPKLLQSILAASSDTQGRPKLKSARSSRPPFRARSDSTK